MDNSIESATKFIEDLDSKFGQRKEKIKKINNGV